MGKKQLNIQIQFGNAEMLTADQAVYALAELLANKGESLATDDAAGKIFDGNGNTVGSWIVIPESDDEPAEIVDELAAEIRDALEGDSNDAEHDALVSVADHFGISYETEAQREDREAAEAAAKRVREAGQTVRSMAKPEMF